MVVPSYKMCYEETESIYRVIQSMSKASLLIGHFFHSWPQKTLRCHFRRQLNMVGMVLKQMSPLGKGSITPPKPDASRSCLGGHVNLGNLVLPTAGRGSLS